MNTIKLGIDGDIDLSEGTLQTTSIESASAQAVKTLLNTSKGGFKHFPLLGASIIHKLNAPVKPFEVVSYIKKEIERGGWFSLNSSDIKVELNHNEINVNIFKAQRIK